MAEHIVVTQLPSPEQDRQLGHALYRHLIDGVPVVVERDGRQTVLSCTELVPPGHSNHQTIRHRYSIARCKTAVNGNMLVLTRGGRILESKPVSRHEENELIRRWAEHPELQIPPREVEHLVRLLGEQITITIL